MGASISVSVDLSGIKQKLSDGNMQAAKYVMAKQILMDMQRFVPRKKGNLRASGYVMQSADILYNAAYSNRQFYAPGGWHYTTAGTGPRWDIAASNVYSEQWRQVFIRGLKL